MGSVEDRFWSKVSVQGDCWVWRTGERGYFWVTPLKGMLAYRFSYQQMIGPIPDGLELDHLCQNPPCVNPYHMDPVPHQVNMQRMKKRKPKPVCKRGHIRPERGSCQQCKIMLQRERRRAAVC